MNGYGSKNSWDHTRKHYGRFPSGTSSYNIREYLRTSGPLKCDRAMCRSQTHSPSAEAFDRGPAKYFHGREEMLVKFRDILWRSKQKEAGTIFLIQGAPGAGKTALLHECEKLARDQEWKTAKISSLAFWNPTELRSSLGSRGIWGLTGGSLQIGTGVFGKIGATVSPESEAILKRLKSGKKPLLLTLDEAQTLGMKDEIPAGKSGTVRYILNAIHNGDVGRPVILVAAGLGPTTKAFGEFGISRFEGGARVELGALGKEAERAILHDWLTEDGKATGDTTAWIGAIAKETHGWPQHILSYVKPALDQLHADKREMTAEGLNSVLEAGHAGRTAYYKQRVDDFRGDQLHCIARAVVDITPGKPVEYRDIMSSLTMEHGDSEAKQLFQRFLEKGVLEKRGLGYAISIPSMHDWLVSNYVRE